MSQVDALLNPASIAVVGASPDARYSGNLIRNLLDYGYDNPIYYVNPNREEAFGQQCYDDISDIPEIVDLVVVSIPRKYVIDVVDQAGEMGIPAALIISAGFSEADETGEELEGELEGVIEKHDMAVCGPNTIGFANPQADTVPSAICSREPDNGEIGLISQSGALAFATFYDRAKDEDIDFAYIIATGNETGLTMSDYIKYMAEDDTVEAICAYIEGIDQPREFINAVVKAKEHGKPVFAVKTGDSDVAKESSESHTGAIAGSEEAWNAAFDRAGVERVPDIEDLLERAKLHAEFNNGGDSVCVASTSGGLAGLLADMTAKRDLALPEITGKTEQQLLEMDELLTFGGIHNPADIRQQGTEALTKIADVVFADDTFDAYVFAVALPAVGEQAEMIADKMLEIHQQASDPVVFLWTGRKESPDEESPYERVRDEAVLYYDADVCMDAVASLLDPPTAGERIDTVSVTNSDTTEVVDWEQAVELIPDSIDVVDHRVVSSSEEAATAASELGESVVLKANTTQAHKTELGAVKTGVRATQAADAFEDVIANVESGQAIVQKQIDGTELMLGIFEDPSFGPVLSVAPGGIHVEAFEDFQLNFIPPVSTQEVMRRVEQSPVIELLTGRGEQIQPDDLAEAVSDLGDLAVDGVIEADLNPVMLTQDGITAVDLYLKK